MYLFQKYLWTFFKVWFLIGLVLVGFSILPPWLEWANAVFLFSSGLYASCYLWTVLPKGRFIIPLIFFGSIAIESFGTHTGLLFGEYKYEADFGPMVLGVPITMGPAWLSVIGASHAFSRLFSFRHRTILLVPLFSVWLDLAIDPVAANVKSYWVWNEGGFYYNIPNQNFFGWYVTALLFSFFIAGFEKETTIKELERNNQYLFMMLHILFGLTAFIAGLNGVLLVGISSVICYLVLKTTTAKSTFLKKDL